MDVYVHRCCKLYRRSCSSSRYLCRCVGAVIPFCNSTAAAWAS